MDEAEKNDNENCHIQELSAMDVTNWSQREENSTNSIHYIAIKMDSTISDHKDQALDIEPIHSSNAENWPITSENANNPTLLYIAVEYVKNNKLETDLTNPNQSITQENYTDFETPQVSPLDPNMSSVAPYSPVSVQYQESGNSELVPIITHQYTKPEENYFNNTNVENSLENLTPTVLCNNDSEEYQYLEMIDNSNVNILCQNDLISETNQQEVELLIPDHTTGILYSVNAQELLVENCLENKQELEAPILEQDLFSLNELNIDTNNSTIITSLANEVIRENIDCLRGQSNNLCSVYGKFHTRSNCVNFVDEEEKLLSFVYSITDKPILSRARASLPEAYLSFSKINGEDAVIAKRKISKRTQFGPLKGILNEYVKENTNGNKFLIMVEGTIYNIDVSDESNSNWMGFVRKAQTYEEQNLIITQEGNDLYFTATMDIHPRKELKYGYSSVYARQFNLEVIKSIENTLKKTYICYKCLEKFPTAEELDKHSIIHAQDENTKPKRRYKKTAASNTNKQQIDLVECNICSDLFNSNVSFSTLKNHLSNKHNVTGAIKIGEHFSVHQFFQCNICNMKFKLEMLLKIHKLEHDSELPLDQPNHVCPQCQRKFPTRKQLIMHVSSHALLKNITKDESVKCAICHKIFAHSIRLQKHMLCHGSEESKPLQCKVCQKRFLTASALAFHSKIHTTGVKHFECPICKERFDHVLKLRLHVPQHINNDVYTCPHCGKTFTKYSIIRKHIRFHSEKNHHCTHCTKSFPTQENLKKHMIRHSDHREFLCADCGKQFKRKDKLVEHIKKRHLQRTPIPRVPKVRNSVAVTSKEPADFHRFIYKCHTCLLGFKRRGMLVNHLAKRHPDIRPDSVPELNLPILQTTRDYYCQYCDKVYKSSSKRKSHILKNHPGAALPVNSGQKVNGTTSGVSSTTFSTSASVTTRPKNCQWCHRQYARRSKLLHHIRKAHPSKVLEEEPHAKEVPVSNFKEEVDTAATDNNIPINSLDKISEQIKEFMPASKDPEPTTYIINQNDEFTDVLQKNQNTTDGNMTEITKAVIDGLIDEDSKYCHLSIDEGELENSNTHLYHLLTSNNGMLPPR